MRKTFASNGITNENFTEVPNLANYFTSSTKMSRSYQVNKLQGIVAFGDSASTITPRSYNGASSTTQLFVDEESGKSKLKRYLGIGFLLGLVLLSITFLTFAIFYDEILDDDNENAEEYWERIQYEIKLIQNKSRAEALNKTLENENFVTILTEPEANSKPSITFENFNDGVFHPKTFYGKWISSDELLHYDNQINLCIMNVTDMKTTVLIPNQIIKENHLSGLSLSPDRQYILSIFNEKTLFRHTSIAIYKVFSIKDNILLPALVSTEYPNDHYLHYAEWGFIGSQIIFIYRNDIFYKSDVNSLPIRITNTGKEMLIYNGRPDWVYEEEIVNGPKMFWGSPDGNDLVFASINDSTVDIMTWPFYGEAPSAEPSVYSQYTKIQSVRYPKPGRPNPIVSLYYIPLSSLQVINNTIPNVDDKIIALEPPQEIKQFGEYLFTTFAWISSEWFAINWMNRAQNFSVMTLYTYKNNFQPISNFRLQSSNGWIDLFKPPLITPDGSSYLIRVPKISDNKREIFEHITKISVNSAKSEFLTSGVFEVKNILDINTETQRIYFMATYPENPGSKHLLSVPFNQTIIRSEPICHTCLMNTYTDDKEKECLTSKVTFSSDAKYYIFECLGPNIPRTEIRKTSDHSMVHMLEDNQALQLQLKDLALPKRIFKKVRVGRYDIDVMLLVPENFKENTTRKYPLLFNVYGGPGSDTGAIVQNYFYNSYSAFMVSNRSVIYAYIDPRGNPNHGSKFMFEIYRKMGIVEVEDSVAVAKYLRDNLPYINKNAVSIWGWSYGGYLATMALESDHDNTIFSCGVAVAPVSNWLYYDSVYTERFMGFPTVNDNLDNYLQSSTLDKVKYLKGKQYLIMFGTADDNVHAMNSMMLLKALNEENIQYQTQIYPDKSHGLENSLNHVYRRMTDFLDNCYSHKT